jgi:methyltransferase (TIGR00027 family)
VAWISARTRFLDTLTIRAMDDGMRQIVIVGAGFDARAFRLPLPTDATVFEIDRGDIFDVKDALVDEAELTPRTQRQTVIADILDPDWFSRLAAVGWNAAEPTVWIVEGLLIYLEPAQRVQLLTQLAEASRGGRLGASLSTASGPMPHPLWQPADDGDPDAWMASTGWTATTETMAAASRSYGRPLPTTRWTTGWHVVSAVRARRTG